MITAANATPTQPKATPTQQATVTASPPICKAPVPTTAVSYRYFDNSYTAWRVDTRQIAQRLDITFEIQPYANTSTGILALFTRSRRDFFAVLLKNELITVVVNFGDGSSSVVNQHAVPKSKYSKINIQHVNREIIITVSGNRTSASASGRFNRLDVDSTLYLGGVPSHVVLPDAVSAVTSSGFRGCIHFVVVNRALITAEEHIESSNVKACNCESILCQRDACSTATGECTCSIGPEGGQSPKNISTDFAHFKNALGSFSTFDLSGSRLRGKTAISFSVKPADTNGLLVYSKGRGGDFFSIGLYEGFIEFRYNLGSGEAVIRSLKPVVLGKWHTLVAQRHGRTGFLMVDGEQTTGSSGGLFSSLDGTSSMFVGGQNGNNGTEVFATASLTYGLTGCITVVTINGDDFDFNRALRGSGVTECSEYPCNCQNGGTCLREAGKEKLFHCACPPQFTGDSCEMLLASTCGACPSCCRCLSASDKVLCYCLMSFNNISAIGLCPSPDFKVAKYKGSSFSAYMFPNPRRGKRRTDVSFNISATEDNSLIFFVKGPHVDFFSIGIQNGQIVVRYNLGTGEGTVNSTVKIIGETNKFHSVIVSRVDNVAKVTVDGISDGGISSEGSATALNVGSDFFVGGIEIATADLREYQDLLGGYFRRGLVGCVEDLTVNGSPIDLASDATRGANLEGCTPFSEASN
eukprot:m.150223 g.150223  ORF g.150223 m.150223 type:complete len:693 (+) comp38549_c0_seq2:1-2079(+)